MAAKFCNGTTVTCEGLSQWGSQNLARQGYNSDQIIRSYYGNVETVRNAPIFGYTSSYPGTPLRVGSSGPNVVIVQTELNRIFIQNKEYNSLMVNILSFGFKNGIPQDADLIFDVRFLPNPFYIEELKEKTGNDVEVQEYVKSFKETTEFMEKLTDMMKFLIPNYVKEGKHQLVVGIGCTGGQHRSVTLANELYRQLLDKGSYGLKITHRDAKKGV